MSSGSTKYRRTAASSYHHFDFYYYIQEAGSKNTFDPALYFLQIIFHKGINDIKSKEGNPGYFWVTLLYVVMCYQKPLLKSSTIHRLHVVVWSVGADECSSVTNSSPKASRIARLFSCGTTMSCDE